jgi:hypothetical protein
MTPSTVIGFLPADPVCDTCGSPLAPAAQDAGSVEQRLNERLRRSRPEPRSEVDVAKARAKPLVLSDYLRQTLAVQCDHFADEMLRLMKEREESGFLTDERAAWMADQVDGWYEFADALRSRRGIK